MSSLVSGVSLNINEEDLIKRGFTKSQIKSLKESQLKAIESSKDVKNATVGDKTAKVAKEVGKQITASDSKGTNTTAQVAGNAASNAALGYTIAGPWGAAAGGVIGGISGALQADANREAADRQVEATRVTSIANIQNKANSDRSAQVNSIINNLSQALLS